MKGGMDRDDWIDGLKREGPFSLAQTAKSLRVDETIIDQALGSDDPKDTLIRLITAALHQREQSAAQLSPPPPPPPPDDSDDSDGGGEAARSLAGGPFDLTGAPLLQSFGKPVLSFGVDNVQDPGTKRVSTRRSLRKSRFSLLQEDEPPAGGTPRGQMSGLPSADSVPVDSVPVDAAGRQGVDELKSNIDMWVILWSGELSEWVNGQVLAEPWPGNNRVVMIGHKKPRGEASFPDPRDPGGARLKWTHASGVTVDRNTGLWVNLIATNGGRDRIYKKKGGVLYGSVRVNAADEAYLVEINNEEKRSRQWWPSRDTPSETQVGDSATPPSSRWGGWGGGAQVAAESSPETPPETPPSQPWFGRKARGGATRTQTPETLGEASNYLRAQEAEGRDELDERLAKLREPPPGDELPSPSRGWQEQSPSGGRSSLIPAPEVTIIHEKRPFLRDGNSAQMDKTKYNIVEFEREFEQFARSSDIEYHDKLLKFLSNKMNQEVTRLSKIYQTGDTQPIQRDEMFPALTQPASEWNLKVDYPVEVKHLLDIPWTTESSPDAKGFEEFGVLHQWMGYGRGYSRGHLAIIPLATGGDAEYSILFRKSQGHRGSSGHQILNTQNWNIRVTWKKNYADIIFSPKWYSEGVSPWPGIHAAKAANIEIRLYESEDTLRILRQYVPEMRRTPLVDSEDTLGSVSSLPLPSVPTGVPETQEGVDAASRARAARQVKVDAARARLAASQARVPAAAALDPDLSPGAEEDADI